MGNSGLDESGSPVTLRTVAEVRAWRKGKDSVGFVPTMGALHQGHLDLVSCAKEQNDFVIVSIFVNPSQFAPHEDLDKYPRDIESDLIKLRGLADAVFVPPVSEMYPSGIVLDVSNQSGTFVEVLGKSHQMEGAIRPHFFRGVATVVTKLLNIVQPTQLFLGQKDVQQCVVVKALISDLCLDVKPVVVPIRREDSGLAMSSRNQYLDSECRAALAPILYKGLLSALDAFKSGRFDRKSLLECATEIITQKPDVHLEYLSLAHPVSLAELESIGSDGAILSGAMRVGAAQVRIIDNILLGCHL
ncbi:pantoate-beta-alanine ligase [Entomophthora muscae]|uniref:Pantoate-beta-alanine ligase n=1 Tax=Entomophthora muscae TaxID=34485 RepID=A0ACC2RQR2_9FUNG|nr:pantoate-beta-alanine ligase [Entomophthora muscae]